MASFSIISAAIGAIAVLIIAFLLLAIARKSKKNINLKSGSLAKSLAAFFDGNEVAAFEEMKKIVVSGQGTPDLFLAIGFLYRRAKQYDKACQVHKILAGQDDLDENYKLLANQELAKDYLINSNPKEALSVLQNSGAVNKNSNNLILLAKGYLGVGDCDSAGNIYLKYKNLTGKKVKGFYQKCMIEKAKLSKDIASALKTVKSAVEFDPDCRPARFITAAIYGKQGKHIKSLDEYKYIITNELMRDINDMKVIEKAFYQAGEEKTLEEILKNKINDKAENPFIYIYMAQENINSNNEETAKNLLYSYLTKIKISIAAAKVYAEIANDVILKNALENDKPFICDICKEEYDEYHDDCTKCGAFDSIMAK